MLKKAAIWLSIMVIIAIGGLGVPVLAFVQNDVAIISELDGHSGAIRDLDWRADGQQLASAGADNSVRTWAWPSGEMQIVENDQSIWSLAYSPDGSQLAYGGELSDPQDIVSHIIIRSTMSATATPPLATSYAPTPTLISDYLFSEIALSGNGRVIAVVGRSVSDTNQRDGIAYPVDFYDTATGQLIHSIQTIWPHPSGLSLNEDGSLIAYRTAYEVAIADTTTGIRTSSMMGSGLELGYTKWNSTSDLVATFAGGAVFVYHGSTGKQDRILFDPEARGLVNGIAWNSNGTKLASTTYSIDSSGSGTAKIQIWDATESHTLDQLPILHFAGGGSISLAWSPDDTQIATNARGGIDIYDAKTGQALAAYSTGDKTPIYQVAWSPDGTKIAAGGPQLIWIWDVSTREIIETFPVSYLADSIVWSFDSVHLYHNGGPDGIYRDASPLSQALLTATATAS